MFKRMFFLLAGVAMTAISTGCCCMNKCNPCGGYGYGAGFAPAASPCGPGGCAPTYGPTGMISQEYAAAYAPPTTTITSAPIFGPAYPTTAFGPMQSLPTY